MPHTHMRRRVSVDAQKVNAWRFDGINDYLDVSGLGGDDAIGVLSFWWRTNIPGTFYRLFQGNSSLRFDLEIQSDGTINLDLRKQGSGVLIAGDFAGVQITDRLWHHLALSYDASTFGTTDDIEMYVDRTQLTPPATTSSGSVDLNLIHHLGANAGGGNYHDGDMAEFFFAKPASYFDLTVEANLNKLITPDGKPANLGPRGEYVLGSIPEQYLSFEAGAAHINKGTGNDWTQNSHLTPALTSPSD